MSEGDLDPQVVAAIERAALAAGDLLMRDKLSAVAAIFAALARRDEREKEAWEIVRAVAQADMDEHADNDGYCSLCGKLVAHPWAGLEYHEQHHLPDCPVTRARHLLATF